MARAYHGPTGQTNIGLTGLAKVAKPCYNPPMVVLPARSQPADAPRTRPGNRIAGSTLPLPPAAPGCDGWASALTTLVACGFDSVDLVDSWVAPADLGDDGVAVLGEALAAAGLTLAGISVVRRSVIDPDSGSANLDHTLRTVDAAQKLGAPVVSIGLHRPLTAEQRRYPFWMVDSPRDARDEEIWALAAERIATIAGAADAAGVQIALELHEGTLIDSAAGALRLIEAIGLPNVGINLDLGNLVRVPAPLAEPWRETVERAAGRVNYWHLKNYVRLEHPRAGLVVSAPVALGDGYVDYGWALRRVLAAGYDGPLCVEHYGGDALWAMREGRRYLEHVLQRQGDSA
jgi:sugar phosphate isomerase/epimerase